MTDSKNKQCEPITTKQFVWAFLLTTAGFAIWLIPVERIISASGLFFLIAMFVIMPSKERLEPVPVSQLIGILIGLALLIIISIAGKHWLPDNWDKWEASVETIMRNPFVVLPLWALTELIIYRRWQLRHKAADNNQRPND